MKQLTLILLSLFGLHNITIAQTTDFTTCLSTQFQSREDNNLDSLCQQLVAQLPDKHCYMIGEAHTFIANSDLQWSLLRALQQRGVYNAISELPQATCFLFNHYLETGDESLLQQLKPEATYQLLQKVRAFNSTLPHDQQIRYYGIDYLDHRYDFSNYQLSLKIILQSTTGTAIPLDAALRNFAQQDSVDTKTVKAFNEILEKALKQDSTQAKAHYGRYYYDLRLMASNMIGYRAHRDERIYKSFLILSDNLVQLNRNNPRFLAFYGVGHMTNLGNKLANRSASPLFNNVCKVGLKYFNCIGGWYNHPPIAKDEGIFSIVPKQQEVLKTYCQSQPWTVAFMTPVNCLRFRYHDEFDAVIFFNAYGTRRMNSWKFD